MFWPQLVGDVEIQERRPRYWNEPRRKRLSFVKPRSGASDEWAMVKASGGRNHYESEQEVWDRRQWEAQERFLHQEHQRIRQREARLQQDRERYMLQHPPPLQPLHGGMHGDPRIQPLPPPMHHGGHHPHEIEDGRHHEDGGHHGIEAVSDSDYSDDDRSSGRRSPVLIELKPKERLPKEFKIHRSKSRCRKYKKRLSSLFSDDSSSDDDDDDSVIGVIQDYRVGRKATRPVSRRGRSRSRLIELSDDSFEDLLKPTRSRSRGGRHSRHRR